MITAIRPYEDRDETEVVAVWYRAGRAVYAFLPEWQTLTIERAGEIFREVIRPQCAIWVAVADQRVVGFLAMKGSYIDRMYVDPAEWRKGCGTQLIECGKTLFPKGLELCTHQENHGARSLYEKHGFRAVRFGVSPAPENVPDVEYHWRPDYHVCMPLGGLGDDVLAFRSYKLLSLIGLKPKSQATLSTIRRDVRVDLTAAQLECATFSQGPYYDILSLPTLGCLRFDRASALEWIESLAQPTTTLTTHLISS